MYLSKLHGFSICMTIVKLWYTDTCANAVTLTYHIFFRLFLHYKFAYKFPFLRIREKIQFSRLRMICLYGGFSNDFVFRKLGNSNWSKIGKIQLNSSLKRLVSTLIFIEQCNSNEKVWRDVVQF